MIELFYMSYVIVTTYFPGVTTAQRDAIYKCLGEKNWVKVTEPGRYIDTVWYARFNETATEQGAIRAAINDFVACSEKYCKRKLALHWGPNKSSFHGLT
jgi:hypothetical protein